MSIKSYFTTTCETRELHSDPQLRSNYYRNKVTEIVNALKEMAEKNAMVMKNFDQIHKELHFVGNGFETIVTLAVVSPIECSIDFKVNYFSMFGLNRPKNKVVSFYKFLKQKLNFKGIALHP